MKMKEKYMLEALKEAKKSFLNGDVPVGAVIVKDNKIISRAHNQKEIKKIATRHAEIIAIEKACKKLNSWYLDGCELYITLEPCLMCAGAIIQSRISRVIYATTNEKFGFAGSIENVLNNKKNNHKVKIVRGVLEEESQKILKEFFKTKRIK
ncbi:MAG: nucleoside deaminase [Mollicutes bacterium]|nr:nucleoside deaminase [Mollicutes bacterium]